VASVGLWIFGFGGFPKADFVRQPARRLGRLALPGHRRRCRRRHMLR